MILNADLKEENRSRRKRRKYKGREFSRRAHLKGVELGWEQTKLKHAHMDQALLVRSNPARSIYNFVL